MSDSASRSAAASGVCGSSRLPSTIEKSHLADSGNDSFTSSDRELSAGGGDHRRESPQPQPARHTSAPLQDHLVHATADLASLAENDDRSRTSIHTRFRHKIDEIMKRFSSYTYIHTRFPYGILNKTRFDRFSAVSTNF